MKAWKSAPGHAGRARSIPQGSACRLTKPRGRTVARSIDDIGDLPAFPSAHEGSYGDLNMEDLSEDMIWSLHDKEQLSSSGRGQVEDWRAFRAKLVSIEKRTGLPCRPFSKQVPQRRESQPCKSNPGAGAPSTSQSHDEYMGEAGGASVSSSHACASSAPAQCRPHARHQTGPSYRSAPFKAGSQQPGNCSARRPTKSVASSAKPVLRLGPGSWAHDLAAVEPGCLLLATGSNMQFFEGAVVLITSHDDVRGTIGFVLNKPSPLRVHDLQVSGTSGGFGAAFSAQRLLLGGPVHLDHITLLHKFAGLSNSHKITDQLYSGGLVDAVKLVEAGLAKPYDFTLALGMSAWGANQVSVEVKRGLWRVVACSPDLVFPRRSATPSEMQDERDSSNKYGHIMSAVDNA